MRQRPSPYERLEDVPEYQRHAHLRGQLITIKEAAAKYGLPKHTISKWVRQGYLVPRGPRGSGHDLMLDEAEVAYMADVRAALQAQYGHVRGFRIFLPGGLPYPAPIRPRRHVIRNDT